MILRDPQEAINNDAKKHAKIESKIANSLQDLPGKLELCNQHNVGVMRQIVEMLDKKIADVSCKLTALEAELNDSVNPRINSLPSLAKRVRFADQCGAPLHEVRSHAALAREVCGFAEQQSFLHSSSGQLLDRCFLAWLKEELLFLRWPGLAWLS